MKERVEENKLSVHHGESIYIYWPKITTFLTVIPSGTYYCQEPDTFWRSSSESIWLDTLFLRPLVIVLFLNLENNCYRSTWHYACSLANWFVLICFQYHPTKLTEIGVDSSFVSWMIDDLTERPLFVRSRKFVTGTLLSSTGTQQGTVLASFFFTFFF